VIIGRGSRLLVAAVVIGWALASACTTGRKAERGRRGFEQSGVASWYGPGFHGKTAANGETYDQEAMTAAHKKLPFGSIVEVKNRDNGKKTRVRITDRGPFVRGRIIDLSKAAARDIDMLGSGIARVKIRVVGHSDRNPREKGPGRGASRRAAGAVTGTYVVQAGAFGDRSRAQSRLAAVRVHYPAARIDSSASLHRIVIPGLTQQAAAEAARTLGRNGIEAVVRQ